MRWKSHFFLLAKRILLLFFLYSFCRLLFFLFNYSYFKDNTPGSIMAMFGYGLRFDITAIVISNIVLIVLHLFPIYRRFYQNLLSFLFITINALALLTSCVDFEFFKFEGKRMTMDIFRIMGFGSDFINTLPHLVADYWYVLIIYIILVTILIRGDLLFRKMTYAQVPSGPGRQNPRRLLFTLSLTLGILFLTYAGFRGGLQYRPINIMTATKYANGKDAELVLNTPFTMLKTIGRDFLKPVHYFSAEEAEKLYPVIHRPEPSSPFRPMNVVLIIMESMGKEYIGSLNHNEGYTPFLDSLIQRSLVFTEAFANAKRSIEGVPGIITSIPALMTEPFITSGYNGNKTTSIAGCLKKKGYETLFFHGGTNGTLGLDNFSHSAGFDHYYGRNEYHDDRDYDGAWGIYDEPFLQFSAQTMDRAKQPFFATIFTLSSHHPYKIPEKYQGVFRKGTLPIHESVQYADYALKRFFETASQMPWFDSTLFVITADHTGLSEYPFYQNQVGMYSVPLIFFKNKDGLQGESDAIVQHADILPSILGFLNYDMPYFSFGSSVFDSTAARMAVNYVNGTYQLLEGDYAFRMDTAKALSLFNFKNDSLLNNNLLHTLPAKEKEMENTLKACIQQYHNAMLQNTMYLK